MQLRCWDLESSLPRAQRLPLAVAPADTGASSVPSSQVLALLALVHANLTAAGQKGEQAHSSHTELSGRLGATRQPCSPE